MMKRLTWFMGGAAAGVVGASVAKKKVKAAASELSPANLAHKAVDRARESVHHGVEVVKAKVLELRHRDTAESAESAEVIELNRHRA